jgi:hypothetical protein
MKLGQPERRRVPATELERAQIPADTPRQRENEALQALTLPASLVACGDVVAVGQRFYGVDANVSAEDRFGFPLMTLRNLETGTSAAIEFRNGDAPVSVLRFPTATATIGEYAPATAAASVAAPDGGWFE